MKIPRHVFREYDIRGIVESELTTSFAALLGQAFGSWLGTKLSRHPVLVVGRDNRPSGKDLAHSLAAGLAATGARVIDVGELPTPALYFAIHHLNADGGIQVTGSHNPVEYNGFKMVAGGESVYGAAIQELWERMLVPGFDADPLGNIDLEYDNSILPAYRDAIAARHRLHRPVRVVVDCGNGVASLVAPATLAALGCDVIPLYCESDGTFPNHHPDPTVPKNLEDLRAEVRRHGVELGIAFDGDGDRIGAVDEDGNIVAGDQLLAIFGRDAVRRFGSGIPVIFDVKCSDSLSGALAAVGAVPVMWKTGHSLIKAKMHETGAPLAGEMSGHIFFGGDWFGFDDALFAAARLIEIVSSGSPGLQRLLDGVSSSYATPEIRIECPDDRKFRIVAEAADHFASRYPVNTIDGVRITFPDGWGLIRASNTQPVLVMRFEGSSPESRDRHHSELEQWLKEHGVT